MIEVITEKEKWSSVINLADEVDFYHTYDYHEIAKNKGETPILIRYSEGDKMIAFPLLLRRIENTTYFDSTSVYGYPGPVMHNIPETYNNWHFKQELQTLFREHNIVSIFTRLNPFLKGQEVCLKGIGSILERGNVVNIDLKRDCETQKQDYSKRLKTYISKAKRTYYIRKACTESDIHNFILIYYETMSRVQAEPHYFFDKNYFFRLMASKDFEPEILLAVNNENQEIVGGALFIAKGNILQYHLSGTKRKYLDLNPIKMIIDEMRIEATNKNLTYFNLGGGLGGNVDSLFKFKSGFSKDYKPFKMWRYILNEKIYDLMSRKNQPEHCNINPRECTTFFPCYRCND